MDKKNFPLEKILTISAQGYKDYNSEKYRGVAVRDVYELKGVHYSTCIECATDIDERISIPLEEFANLVPENAEVVVDFKNVTSAIKDYFYIQMSGTALIPKK